MHKHPFLYGITTISACANSIILSELDRTTPVYELNTHESYYFKTNKDALGDLIGSCSLSLCCTGMRSGNWRQLFATSVCNQRNTDTIPHYIYVLESWLRFSKPDFTAAILLI